MIPNPDFKVTGYLKVKYLADDARVFNCTKHSCKLLGALPKTWVSSVKFFFAESAGRCFTQWWKLSLTKLVFVETSTQTYSLSEEGFGYNCGRLKSSPSQASRENTMLRCGKIKKCRRHLQHRFVDGRTDGAYLGDGAVLGVSIALFTTHRRWCMELVTCLAKSRNGPKMVPCLLTSTDC